MYALFKDGKQETLSYEYEWQVGYFEKSLLQYIVDSKGRIKEGYTIEEINEIN